MNRILLILFLLLLPAHLPAIPDQPESLRSLLSEKQNLLRSNRSEIAKQISRIEQSRKAEAIAFANSHNLPVRFQTADGRIKELISLDNGNLLYLTTLNREAAITTSAGIARSSFNVDGSGFTIGVWDAGAILATHEAFQNRISIKNNVSPDNHATHIAGTIGAAGPNSRAHGMSPAVHIDSYDWNEDRSELTERGASYPNEPGKISLSNHSYGFVSGWDRSSGATDWTWHGNGTTSTATETRFGQYNSRAADIDALLENLPYLLPFWAAGNDRDNNPPDGSSVKINGNTHSYNRNLHPPGDGIYKNGFDTIGHEATAKNLITIGAASDAVTAGHRDLSKATMPAFSSWGPTDDGRIKPDLVANGTSLYSTRATDDTAYGTTSGTSMATANATGSAQLVISHFDNLFPGHRMRASTLKALLIHTADDLGTPGPDYRFGWGLLNTENAIRQIDRFHANPGGFGIIEAELKTAPGAAAIQTHTFESDGISPIRATIAWTDPAGTPTTTHDNRSSRLVNDLDLQIIAPDNQVFYPFVMPHTLDWETDSLTAPAITGINSTDNVEQVLIEFPPMPGTYTLSITTPKPLKNNSQIYSLILSGASPATAPPPEITEISPQAPLTDILTFSLAGTGFQLGATVEFIFPGEPTQNASGLEIIPNRITGRLNTSAMREGFWDIRVTNSDGQSATLPSAFAIGGTFWKENFDTPADPWETFSTSGTSSWSISSSQPFSPPNSIHGSGPGTAGIDEILSPIIPIPENADNLLLSFQHRHRFSLNHGGVIELSIDGGPWFDPDSENSGAEFLTGEYSGRFTTLLPAPLRNPLAGRRHWNGNLLLFSPVTLSLESEKYAGQNLQIRWRISTDSLPAGQGWWIDDISLSGSAETILPIPVITTAPSATPETITGTTTSLTVTASDPASSPLTYSWKLIDPPNSSISFSENNSETSNNTTATFSSAGPHLFEVTARNQLNGIATASVTANVIQTPAELHLSPASASIPANGTLLFIPEITDQFSSPIESLPSISWSIDNAAGTIAPNGLFTAAETTGGPFLLTAETGQLSATAEISIRHPAFPDWLKNHFSPEELANPEISSPGADPDGDGLTNLLEYALGSNPTLPDREHAPRLEQDETGLLLTFTRPTDRLDLIYQIETSTDLTNWEPVPETTWEIEPSATTETIRLRQPLSHTLFLRLRIDLTE